MKLIVVFAKGTEFHENTSILRFFNEQSKFLYKQNKIGKINQLTERYSFQQLEYKVSSMLVRIQKRSNQKWLTTDHTADQSYVQIPPITHHNKYYDTFAFRDRMTNHQFKYKEARQLEESPLQFKQWKAKEFSAKKELKNILSVYKFTKKFQMNCLRDKYFKPNRTTLSDDEDCSKQQVSNVSKNRQTSMNKSTLFQINKQQLQRVLKTNQKVNPDIIKLNKPGMFTISLKQQKNKKTVKKWIKIQNTNQNEKQNLTSQQKEVEVRIKQKIINHMKCQLKDNGQYLLNLPIQKKRKQLIKSQFKKERSYRHFQFPKYDNSDIQSYSFNHMKTEQLSQLIKQSEGVKTLSVDQLLLLQNMKEGYINQVYMKLNNQPELYQVRDAYENNLFHLAAKDGNFEMVATLFNVIPAKNCYLLLNSKNHLKRTPSDKAKMLCHHSVRQLFDDFIDKFQKNNK